MVETYGGGRAAFDAVVFLQTIEHVQDPAAVLRHFRSLLAPGGVAYVSTPNLLTLAPPGAAKSDNPWHIKEYRAAEFEQLCRDGVRRRAAARPVPRPQAAPARAGAGLRLGRRARAAAASPSRSMTASPRRSPPATSRCATTGLDRALDFLAVCRRPNRGRPMRYRQGAGR